MDSGKVTLMIPADAHPFEASERVAQRLGWAIVRHRLGYVASVGKLLYEPFTPDIAAYGRRWHEITLFFEVDIADPEAAALFRSAGCPASMLVTFTECMRMCGRTLGDM